MKNYPNNDYAVNKNAKGIVYQFVDGTNKTITVEDDLRESPGKTESDFAKFKALSDDDYFQQDRSDYRQTWKNVSFHGLDGTAACSVPSPEDEIIERPEQIAKEQRRRELGLRAFAALTEVQQRRYIQHKVKNMSARKIAMLEGTNHKTVLESLQAAEKKIKKVLAKG